MPNQRPIVEFPENVPVTLSLDYPRGKVVSGRYGERVMFSVDHNRVMFLDPETAGKVENLGLTNREKFQMTKIGKAFEVSRLSPEPGAFGDQPDGTYAVPALPEQKPPERKGPVSESNGHSRSGSPNSLLDEANTLIDTFEAAWRRARQKYDGIKPEEVRALVISAYIKRTREAA